MSSGERTCVGTRLDGEPCASTLGIDDESGLCIHHDPARADEALAMRRRGGLATRDGHTGEWVNAMPEAAPDTLETLSDAVPYTSWVIRMLGEGHLPPKVGSAMLYGLQRFATIAEKRDMEQEIKALQAQLKDLQQGRAPIRSA